MDWTITGNGAAEKSEQWLHHCRHNRVRGQTKEEQTGVARTDAPFLMAEQLGYALCIIISGFATMFTLKIKMNNTR